MPFFGFFQLNRLELGQQFSFEVVISIDPQGLTEPGRLHVAYVISTITYSGEYDNFTDPNNGTRLTKTSDNFHTSFYFYVPGLLRSARLDAFNLSLLSTPI